ncbi:MAG: 1-acyl-sn-glycerol-3-phosphate acyltransferase [Clostridia bacterium]|nr:1-acyl-sn-glycerol-3-phosphate acyltransferase [Clostridia bacterium]
MFETYKSRINQKVMDNYADALLSIDDLVGDGYSGLSPLFYVYNKRYLHWLDNDPDIAVSEKEILFRRKFYRVLQKIGPGAMKCTQVYESRRFLDDSTTDEKDTPVALPEKPVIFVANHGFHDDCLSTVLAAGRHIYFVWGSLPVLYNTIDGLASSFVGGVCVNRKSKTSRHASIAKALKAMEYGADLLIFPEGGWNKTSERLLLDYWKGVYTLSKAAECDVVPIVHYVRDMEVLDKKNLIHTVVDDPIPLYTMPQDEALQYLRDLMASWLWKMAEQYGQSARDVEMQGYSNSRERWEAHLKERMKGVSRYDSEVEKNSEYRPKTVIRAEDVFRPIANIQNISAQNIKSVLHAKELVKTIEESDWQKLF